MNIKTPSNLYSLWNIGSMIMITMSIQTIIGFTLSMNYMSKTEPFNSSFNIYYNINYGWLIRLLHSNMTSLIFILMIIHIKRNIVFMTFNNYKMWISGMIMFLMTMMISFLGYSLIFSQMSYWAMMVITNFISSIPKVGELTIKWIWGSFNINSILINRFFSIHFILPLMLMMLSIIHLMILHLKKSTNPLGINNKLDQSNLNPKFLIKDFYLYMIILTIFMNLNLMKPWMLNNPDNFNKMNYFKTPNHIEPEWYFLFFYSILRSIENKLSGLMMMLTSILMILIMPYIMKNKFQSNLFIPVNMTLLKIMLSSMIIITYLGSKIMEFPFNLINNSMIMIYLWNFVLMKMMK